MPRKAGTCTSTPPLFPFCRDAAIGCSRPRIRPAPAGKSTNTKRAFKEAFKNLLYVLLLVSGPGKLEEGDEEEVPFPLLRPGTSESPVDKLQTASAKSANVRKQTAAVMLTGKCGPLLSLIFWFWRFLKYQKYVVAFSVNLGVTVCCSFSRGRHPYDRYYSFRS